MFDKHSVFDSVFLPPVASPIAVDDTKCFQCGGCVAVCPPNAIFLQSTHLTISEACTRCERCVTMCPVHALSLAEDAAAIAE